MLAGNCPRAGAWTGRTLLTEGRHRCADQAGAQTIGLHRLDDRAMRNCPQARNYKPKRPPLRLAGHLVLASWNSGPPIHLSLNRAQLHELFPAHEDHSVTKSPPLVSSKDSNPDLFHHKTGRKYFAWDRIPYGRLPHVSR